MCRDGKKPGKLARYKQAAWQDWKNGQISPAEYHHMKEDYDGQIAKLEQIIKNMEKEKVELEKSDAEENSFIAA